MLGNVRITIVFDTGSPLVKPKAMSICVELHVISYTHAVKEARDLVRNIPYDVSSIHIERLGGGV